MRELLTGALLASLLLPLNSAAEESVAELLKQANAYAARHDFAKATDALAKALGLTEAKTGPNHPDVAIMLGNLAASYEARNDFASAESLRERALGIMRNTLEVDDPLMDEARLKLADVERRLAKFGQAESLYRESIQTQEKNSDPPMELADALDGLAATYVAQGKYAQAEPLYARSLKIYEGVFGANDPALMKSLLNLASAYAGERRYDLAKPLYDRALKIGEARHRGGELMADILDGLAEASRREGDLAAEQAYRGRAAAMRSGQRP